MNKTALISIALLALGGCKSATDTGNTTSAATPAGSSGAVAPTVANVAPPKDGDWSAVVTETPDGGYLMGNPAAAAKIVEYGALSCPHCAAFQREAHDELPAMVKTGKVSYELRPFLVHPQIDLPATLLAGCNGPQTFFAMADQFFQHQDVWMAQDKFKRFTPQVQQAWSTMTPSQQAADVADKLDLLPFVAQRGLSSDKAKACLASPAALAREQNLMSVAEAKFAVNQTPTFILNGQVVPGVGEWGPLKAKITAITGG